MLWLLMFLGRGGEGARGEVVETTSNEDGEDGEDVEGAAWGGALLWAGLGLGLFESYL